MINPATKASEIKDQLTSAIDSRLFIGEFDFAMIKREISRLPDEDERAFLMGLAYGAANKQEDAIRQLEHAVNRYGDPMAMHDYILYLKKSCRYVSAYANAIKFALQYDIPELVKIALTTSQMFYDLEMLRLLSEKLKKYYPDTEDELLGDIQCFISNVELACADTGCSEGSLKKVVMIFHQLAESQLIHIESGGIITDIEGMSYECEVECDSPELLAKLNYQISSELAEHIDVLQQGLTGWFKVKLDDSSEELEYAC